MNVKALVIAGAATGVAMVTLVALNLVAPISRAEAGSEQGVTVDEVFGASIAETGASSPAPRLSTEVALADTTSAEPATATPADTVEPAATSAEPRPVATSSPSGTTPGGSCAMDLPANGQLLPVGTAQLAQAPATEPSATATDASTAAPGDTSAATAPPAGPAVAGGACSASITDPNQPPIVVKAVGAPGDTGDTGEAIPEGSGAVPSTEPATDAGVDAAQAPAPAPAAEPEPAAPEPAPAAAEPEPAPAAASKPAPAPATSAPAPQPKTAKPRTPKAAPPEAKKAWWPAKTPGKLNLTYAGSASFTKAIVLMFDGAFDSPDKANEHIKVTTASGTPVKGQWLVAKGNPQMLLYSVEPGVYKVQVGGGLTDKGNRALSAESGGAVFVP